MKELSEHEAWKLLKDIATVQQEQRKNVILGPAENADSALKVEYMKGELQGIALFLQLPELIVADSKETLKRNETIPEGDDE